ncbi:MAG: ABC transporter ATP-binding protein [Deltaproteobacteria bacterium]|nr:ABC transporter ATP-binding protein [Deltaproteobacteria bacterium]
MQQQEPAIPNSHSAECNAIKHEGFHVWRHAPDSTRADTVQKLIPKREEKHCLVLQVRNLKVEFTIEGRRLTAVSGTSFDVKAGRTTGLVGESGCGKSASAFAVMRLIPTPPGEITGGEILFKGRDLLKIPIEEMRLVRGKEIAMIFQEPMTALNPVYTIEHQMAEVYRLHCKYPMDEIRERSVKMLERVGIPEPQGRLKDYPHQLSGGQRQRVMIAMALSLSPCLLIADEPTTALDVTIQAQILELMCRLKEEGGMATVLITHDLGVVAETCDDVVVMYAGEILETASVYEIFKHPLHPYTKGLMDCIPRMGRTREGPLSTIEGMVPDLFNPPQGCRFADRCFKCQALCRQTEPELKTVVGSDKRQVACWFPLE